MVGGFHYSLEVLFTELHECPQGMTANFPRKVSPENKADATETFTTYPQKLYIVVFTNWPHRSALIRCGETTWGIHRGKDH